MLYLIQNWNNINFKNYELTKDLKWNFSIIIDNNVKIQFVHYKFNPACKKITVDNSRNIFYYKIWEYIIQKFEERLNRMIEKKEQPIFCICNFDTIYPDAIYTNEQLNILSKYDNVYILRGCEHKKPCESANIFYKRFLRHK